ncbi:MAG: T9SS type A sorting domain-containing protein [Draconibacterium sp.]|nr:T9SS type A sorting domain-containing protein [Draconibacterium sp.]
MKRIFTLTAFIALFLTSNLFAQDILVVEPGVGTLNAAIATNGGDKIYQLQAGKWYQLDAIIENVDYHLQIIGEEPADGGIPATLQTNTNAEGVTFERMFNAFGDITIKGVYIMNIDLLGVKGTRLLGQNKENARTVIDNCIIDPVSLSNAVEHYAAGPRTYFTNNQVFNMGTLISPNDGHFFVAGETGGLSLDTLYVENNTFVCMGTNMFAGGFTAVTHGYINFNHNTFVMQKSQFDWSVFEEAFIFTNNLLFDAQTQPWAYTWQPMPGGDVNQPMPALIYADTIPGEVLPSTRKQFWQYNMLYRNPDFYPMVDSLNVKAIEFEKAQMYYMPLLWPEDSMNAQPGHLPRETFLFANDEAFPDWKFGNYTENIDPQWVDQKIYENSAKFVEWTYPASLMHALGVPDTEYPPTSEWTDWHWNPDGDHTINDAWPIFNGVYTNPELLKASIENLPLGDLNWYPESMAKWEADKDAIDAHIHAGIEGKFVLTAVESQMETGSFRMYPNPAQNELNFDVYGENEILIRSIDGRTIMSVYNVSRINISDLNSGMYLVTLKEGNKVSTKKLIIER